MSYYILPKNFNNVNVNPLSSIEFDSKPYISHSLAKYYKNMKKQISDLFSNDLNAINIACKLINPYEFIFSKVPGSKFSVSKLKPRTNLFYDLLEISRNLNILESFEEEASCNFLHASPNYNDSLDCFEMFRENPLDNHICKESIDINDINDMSYNKFDVLFYETDISDYFLSLIKLLMLIFKFQKKNGHVIIKIDNMFHKTTIDTLYLLSSIYDKVYLCKPNTNDVTLLERYIVCKNFMLDERSNTYLKYNYLKLIVFIKKLEGNNVSSILDNDIPYYFKNKIDELNIIIGQQQIDALEQIIMLYKNKSKNDKIELLKKNNIQKSVSWCEKYKIPCNKFAEKVNIFLPIANDV
jgi:hypothetical protein